MTEGFDGFMFGPMPPEIKEALHQERERRDMHMTDNTHAIKQFFNGLDKEQLRALDLLLANCDSATDVAFFRGRISSIRETKFEVCSCGKDHEAELASFGPESSADEGRSGGDSSEVVNWTVDPTLADSADAEDQSDEELMVKYGIEENPLYDPHAFMGASPFRCINCHVGVASLKDRMLRKPGIEGCSGCQQKSAWG